MKHKVRYSKLSMSQIDEIMRYYAENVSPDAGRRIYGELCRTIDRLSEFPLMGPLHFDSRLAAQGYRLLVLTKTYVAVYRVNDDTIYIYGVFNGRTDYPQLLR